MNIILASQSPRRKDLLSYLFKDFKILTADLDEEIFLPLARTSEEFVTKLSLAKAKKVIAQYKIFNSLIIAADTIVVLQKNEKFQIIGKQKNELEASITLKSLRGKTHQVYTGFTVINQKTNQSITDFSISNVTFKLFSDKFLKEYLIKFKPYDKAGAYAIQEMGSKYIERFDGSLSGIIGLPLEKVGEVLEKFEIKLKSNWQENIKKQITFK